MGAAARGVDREKGYILGIAPRFFDKPGVLYEHCTEFILRKICVRGSTFWKAVPMRPSWYLVELVRMRSF